MNGHVIIVHHNPNYTFDSDSIRGSIIQTLGTIWYEFQAFGNGAVRCGVSSAIFILVILVPSPGVSFTKFRGVGVLILFVLLYESDTEVQQKLLSCLYQIIMENDEITILEVQNIGSKLVFALSLLVSL